MSSFLKGLWTRIEALIVGVRAVAVKDEALVQALVARGLKTAATDVRSAEAQVLAAIKADTPALEAAAKKAAADVIAAVEAVLAHYGV